MNESTKSSAQWKAIVRALNGTDILIAEVEAAGVDRNAALTAMTVALARVFKLHGIDETEWKRIVGSAYATMEEMKLEKRPRLSS